VSAVENGEVEEAEAIQVRDHADFGDLAIREREAAAVAGSISRRRSPTGFVCEIS
jgi:hypothetical protein